MKARFMISGSLVAEAELDSVPAVGTVMTIEMTSYKKGHFPGTILQFPVGYSDPPFVDDTADGPTIFIDVNGWEVIKDGPVTDDRDA